MWISVRETFIEERELTLLNNRKCPSGKVLLRLIRRDVRASFFLFPKKVIEVVCPDTNKKIKKSQWSPEIKRKAKAMKANLTVPTWGYWSIGLITLVLLLAIPIGFLMEIKDAEKAQDLFISQNALRQKEILKMLSPGDLVATQNDVYKISSTDTQNVILIKSSIPGNIKNSLNGLSSDAYPDSSFKGNPITVTKSLFLSSRISQSDMIVAILDN